MKPSEMTNNKFIFNKTKWEDYNGNAIREEGSAK